MPEQILPSESLLWSRIELLAPYYILVNTEIWLIFYQGNEYKGKTLAGVFLACFFVAKGLILG